MKELLESNNKKNILTLTYTWLAIILSINLFHLGYTLSLNEGSTFSDENYLYNVYIDGSNSLKIITDSIISIAFSTDEITAEGSQSNTFLEIFDAIANIALIFFFIIQFITLGGILTSFSILIDGAVNGGFFFIITTALLAVGNIIYLIKISQFIIKKGRDD